MGAQVKRAPMPLIHDHPQVPPEGHYFPDQTGVTIRGDSVRDLVAKVTDYRATNGLPMGSPSAEIETFYAGQFPWLISKVGAAPAADIDPFAEWLRREWKEPIKEWSMDYEIDQRQKKCAECPHFSTLPDTVTMEQRRRLLILMGGKSQDVSPYCAHFFASLAVVWRRLSPLLRRDGVNSDALNCWIEPTGKS